MINLASKQQRDRLFKAIKTSRDAMASPRKTRNEMIRDYVGSWYSTGGARYKTLANLMNQTAKIYTVALAANNPWVRVTTPVIQNWSFAKKYQVNLNKLISDMQLEQTFRAVVLDSFFLIGAVAVMMRDTDTRYHGLLESEEDQWFDPGEPWLNRIGFDNLILDMSAAELSKMRFCGHRYRADFEKVKEESAYDKAVVDKLTPTSKNATDNADLARDIASGGAVDDDELKPMIWLQDVWIPENRSVATFAVDFEEPPLIEREWTGSQGGPYKFLSLGLVPDNVIPASPAMNLKGLHDLQNRLHRRMEKDSDAHRRVNVYAPGSGDDAKRLQEAKRNEWVRMRNPSEVKQVELGGISSSDQAFSIFVQEQYDRFAGNLRAMGGLGAEAGTLGQEEIVQGNVSRMEESMRQAVVEFAEECCAELAQLMWNDEWLEIQSAEELGSTGVYVDASWRPEDRQGRFEDYKFRVEQYSMVYKSPQAKVNELFATLQQLAPLWPMFQASGAALDVRELVDILAELQDRPELKRIITFASSGGRLGGDQNTIRSPAVTTRNEVRRNVATGGTPQARSAILQQVLSGASKPQVSPQQAAVIGRPA